MLLKAVAVYTVIQIYSVLPVIGNQYLYYFHQIKHYTCLNSLIAISSIRGSFTINLERYNQNILLDQYKQDDST